MIQGLGGSKSKRRPVIFGLYGRYNGVKMLIVDEDAKVKSERLECGSFAFEMNVGRYGGHDYFRLGKFRKWSQDGKFHPDHTISIKLEDFRDKVLPAIAALFDKQLV